MDLGFGTTNNLPSILEDTLERLTILKTWASRYVVLTKDSLIFCRKKGAMQWGSTVINVNIEVADSHLRHFCFRVSNRSTQETIYLSCKSYVSKELWKDKIMEVVQSKMARISCKLFAINKTQNKLLSPNKFATSSSFSLTTSQQSELSVRMQNEDVSKYLKRPQLCVRINKARRLWHDKEGGPSLSHSSNLSCFVEVRLGSSTVRTSARKGQHNPSWGIVFPFEWNSNDRVIRIEVLTEDSESSLGCIHIPVWHILRENSYHKAWYDLRKNFNSSSTYITGQLQIELKSDGIASIDTLVETLFREVLRMPEFRIKLFEKHLTEDELIEDVGTNTDASNGCNNTRPPLAPLIEVWEVIEEAQGFPFYFPPCETEILEDFAIQVSLVAQTATGRLSTSGILFLTNYRLLFVSTLRITEHPIMRVNQILNTSDLTTQISIGSIDRISLVPDTENSSGGNSVASDKVTLLVISTNDFRVVAFSFSDNVNRSCGKKGLSRSVIRLNCKQSQGGNAERIRRVFDTEYWPELNFNNDVKDRKDSIPADSKLIDSNIKVVVNPLKPLKPPKPAATTSTMSTPLEVQVSERNFAELGIDHSEYTHNNAVDDNDDDVFSVVSYADVDESDDVFRIFDGYDREQVHLQRTRQDGLSTSSSISKITMGDMKFRYPGLRRTFRDLLTRYDPRLVDAKDSLEGGPATRIYELLRLKVHSRHCEREFLLRSQALLMQAINVKAQLDSDGPVMGRVKSLSDIFFANEETDSDARSKSEPDDGGRFDMDNLRSNIFNENQNDIRSSVMVHNQLVDRRLMEKSTVTVTEQISTNLQLLPADSQETATVYEILRLNFTLSTLIRRIGNMDRSVCDCIFDSFLSAMRIYDPIQEFARMKIPDSKWRLTQVNKTYGVTPTYPALLAVPIKIDDKKLVPASNFRSRNRFPTLSWRSVVNNCTICRSSQPKSGITGQRNLYDEELIREIMLSSGPRIQHAGENYLIADARSYINARANQATGKGFENLKNYEDSMLLFLDIPNIHVMRKSIETMAAACVDETHWLKTVEQSGWLQHLAKILKGALRIVHCIAYENVSVLVHCSDGWDRTTQLTSLAMLLLDPYYRTLRGFVVLIEKEWMSFGHKFADRLGWTYEGTKEKEKSPIFLQFLDCVHQCVVQHPRAFEFNEDLLVFLAEHIQSGWFGNFMFNTEQERKQFQNQHSYISIWMPVLTSIHVYTNELYKTQPGIVLPIISGMRMTIWTRYFSCWHERVQRATWLQDFSFQKNVDNFETNDVPTRHDSDFYDDDELVESEPDIFSTISKIIGNGVRQHPIASNCTRCQILFASTARSCECKKCQNKFCDKCMVPSTSLMMGIFSSRICLNCDESEKDKRKQASRPRPTQSLVLTATTSDTTSRLTQTSIVKRQGVNLANTVFSQPLSAVNQHILQQSQQSHSIQSPLNPRISPPTTVVNSSATPAVVYNDTLNKPVSPRSNSTSSTSTRSNPKSPSDSKISVKFSDSSPSLAAQNQKGNSTTTSHKHISSSKFSTVENLDKIAVTSVIGSADKKVKSYPHAQLASEAIRMLDERNSDLNKGTIDLEHQQSTHDCSTIIASDIRSQSNSVKPLNTIVNQFESQNNNQPNWPGSTIITNSRRSSIGSTSQRDILASKHGSDKISLTQPASAAVRSSIFSEDTVDFCPDSETLVKHSDSAVIENPLRESLLLPSDKRKLSIYSAESEGNDNNTSSPNTKSINANELSGNKSSSAIGSQSNVSNKQTNVHSIQSTQEQQQRQEKQQNRLSTRIDIKYHDISWDDVITKKVPQEGMLTREFYLDDATFWAKFGCTKEAFKTMPKWKRDKLKKELNLF